MDEMTARESGLPATTDMVIAALGEMNRRQSEQLCQMALQIRTMSELVDELRKEVRALEKITPMQVTELNALLRKRGKELCDEYGLIDRETKVNSYIRAAVKAEFGISSMKELCRSDFTLCKSLITMWEDSAKLFGLRR